LNKIDDIKNNLVETGTKDFTCNIKWFLIDVCNYDCSYCISHWYNNNHFKELNKSNKIKITEKLVLAKLKKFPKKFKMELTGGEPILHPRLFEIAKEISSIDNCELIKIFSNFSEDPKLFAKYKDISKITWIFSYHSEYTTLNEFLNKLEILSNLIDSKRSDDRIHININMFQVSQDELKIIKKHPLNKKMTFHINYLANTDIFEIIYDKEDFDTDVENEPKIPFITNDNTYLLTHKDITHYNLQKFSKPRMCQSNNYLIRLDGEFTHACLGFHMPLSGPKDNYYCEIPECGCILDADIYKKIL
jgi:MoaA/NifB/PqqE/SkfB family radical SAM enzyme